MQILALIDAIDYLENETARNKRRLNSARAHTKELPDEMILRIFSFLCPTEATSMGCRNSRSSARKEHPTADLRRVSQVCSMWREVALGSPCLWSTGLDFNNEGSLWLKELVCRCESVPIHITADCSSIYDFRSCGGAFKARGMIDKFEMILSSSPNIGSISMVYFKNSPFVAIIENFISQCSSATRLSLTAPCRIPKQFRREWDNIQTDGELPSLGNHCLRQLEVTGYRPDLTLPCFRQLAWLSVSLLSGVTAIDWVRVLAGLPKLEHLRLEDAVSRNTFQVGGSGSNVQFPSMKTLALIGEFNDGIGDFLSTIEATKKYSLLLHCTLTNDSKLDQLLYGLRNWFASWNINLHSDVGFRRVEFMASHSRFRLHNQIPGNELSDEWFRIFLNWGRIPNPHSIRKLQSDIFRIFGPVLRQTRTLFICPDRYDRGYICGPNFWQDYFHGVRTLRFLTSGVLDHSTTSCFINALCNDIERCTTSVRPLSQLRVLSFENENFSYHRVPLFENKNFSYHPGVDCIQSLERLSKVLGHRMDVVELYACNGTSDVRRSLMKHWVTRVLVSEEKSPRF